MVSKDNNRLNEPINVAVVGHTNAGKTSLIRTLVRDEHFGKIDDAAGTTRYVEKSIVYSGENTTAENEVLVLFDTPGFEDSSALLQELEDLSKSIQTRVPADLLTAFITQANDFPDFEQETKVLRQSLNSDVLLYIIDVREPLLGKYIDEVEILTMAGLPILPVFNFIAGNDQALASWRERLTQFNLHAALEFDTVAFDFEAEKRLYQKLQSLLEKRYDDLQTLIDYRQDVWNNLAYAAAQRIFQLLTTAACYRLEVTGNGATLDSDTTLGSDTKRDIDKLQSFVRNAEKQALQDLLAIFAFNQLDIELQQLPVDNDTWELDIFSPEALKTFGLNAGATALKGAAAGAGIDLMVGGMSLGAAAALGGALGASWATLQRYQQEIKAAIQGNKWLCVDDNTVSLLYLRQYELLRTLMHRGHAAQNKLLFGKHSGHSLPKQWPKVISVLRQNPEWQNVLTKDEQYQRLQSQVINWLLNSDVKTDQSRAIKP